MPTDQLGQIAEGAGNKAMWGGVIATIIGWAGQYNMLGWFGLLCAVVGLAVNWYYKHKHYQLALKAFEAKSQEEKGA